MRLNNGASKGLQALLLYPQDAAAKGLIVHLHGGAGDAALAAADTAWLAREGYAVLAAEYRGYRGSPSVPTIAGVHEDAAAALRWAMRRVRGGALPVILCGESIGAAAAMRLAAQPEFHGAVAAVIADSPFTSYRAIFRERLEAAWYGGPFRFLAAVLPRRHDPIDCVSQVAPIPLLLIHSKQDRLVPVEHAIELFAAAREPKELWLTEEAGHAGALRHEVMRCRIAAYLNEINAGRARPNHGLVQAGPRRRS